ncbi:MAG: hypothetical protein HQ506_10345 [Candidatus Marinimicrobia bacterium]|nr:hypothetical protein [Candidatus Neomarinimicrobiota bacterium]
MNSKNHLGVILRFAKEFLLQTSTITIILTLFISCGNWGWESIDTDNEEKLNIFGLISLDDSLESFVIVHKTLETSGPDDRVVGSDTIYYHVIEWYNEDTGGVESDTNWYEEPWVQTITEPLYIVKDATVIISDGTQDFEFHRQQPNLDNHYFYWRDDYLVDLARYVDTTGQFTPQANTLYTLTISTPGGLAVTGSLTTPSLPVIYESTTIDTVSMRQPFQVSWAYAGDFTTLVATGYPSDDYREFYLCGMEQQSAVEPGDTTWTSTTDPYCFDEFGNSDQISEMDIRVRFVDDNYAEYFVHGGGDAGDISNILIGEGGIGEGFGIEGGFGVFGALSSSRIKRHARE